MLSMAIVGGAVMPFARAYVADKAGLQISFLIPACWYTHIAVVGLKCSGIYRKTARS
jgi:FHS family L-fucose permease-like MFS transporter